MLKTVCYVEHEELTATSEVVDTGEIMVFVGQDFVVTVRHGLSTGRWARCAKGWRPTRCA